MNRTKYSGHLFRKIYHLLLLVARIGAKRECKSFGRLNDPGITRIEKTYVINLDRQVSRWNNIQGELRRLVDCTNTPLCDLTTRFSAIDAKSYVGPPKPELLEPYYSLSDQFFVEPEPSLLGSRVNLKQRIEMTAPEIAVALSHISIWRAIASGCDEYSLVLEDDVYFRRDFAEKIDRAWGELNPGGASAGFDILYLSYEEARNGAEKDQSSDHYFRPRRGLWHLSGYVLSKKGAQKLLELLPVRGPVDLWINHQFDKIDVLATSRSIISQRSDYRSDNSYSILPVLSKIGVQVHDTSSVFRKPPLPKPVFAMGDQGTGLTSLAAALSMLGYRCCNDIGQLPKSECDNLLAMRETIFDAYVNIGSFEGLYDRLAHIYPHAKFIVAVNSEREYNNLNDGVAGKNSYGSHKVAKNDSFNNVRALFESLHRQSIEVLILPADEKNKWQPLCAFLGCDPPTSRYPAISDHPQRLVSNDNAEDGFDNSPRCKNLKWDSSPWIAAPTQKWRGIPIQNDNSNWTRGSDAVSITEQLALFDDSRWRLLDDTFPSNSAMFSPDNFLSSENDGAKLIVRKEVTPYRKYTAASIGTRQCYLYGRFEAEIKAAKVSGLVTGLFLHRNNPRHEIDIEILGRDTTKMLINVFYNPGTEGANFDYGYRGTPELIELGFDASERFHHYAIVWTPTAIRWLVDGRLVHERVSWNPTPIPDLPMQFYFNTWPSRSRELAGKLSDADLPAQSEVRRVHLLVKPS